MTGGNMGFEAHGTFREKKITTWHKDQCDRISCPLCNAECELFDVRFEHSDSLGNGFVREKPDAGEIFGAIVVYKCESNSPHYFGIVFNGDSVGVEILRKEDVE